MRMAPTVVAAWIYSSGGTGRGNDRTPSALLRWKLSISAGELAGPLGLY